MKALLLEGEPVRRRAAVHVLGLFALTGCLALALSSAWATPAWANAPIHSFTTEPSTTQAGGHPDIVISYSFGNRFTQTPVECFCNDPENIKTSLPPGMIGDPHATPQCSRVDFGTHSCSPSAQIGVVTINLVGNVTKVPIYNLEPSADQAGFFGFYAPLVNAPIFTVVSARTGGDYGLDFNTDGIEHIIPAEAISYDLWGVPAARRNDFERAPLGEGKCGFGQYPCFGPNVSDAEPIPFLDNPTSCGEPLTSFLEIQSYDGGASTASAPYKATTGCDQLSFNPSLYAQPTAAQTDSPSGLDVDLSVPQSVSPSTPSPSEIRALAVTLPDGMSINPNAADGKAVCTDAEAKIGAYGSDQESQCPEQSEIGTVELTSTALPGVIPGYAYLGEPKPGERYRLIVTANGFATHVKLAGSVQPDPQTGRLTVSFPGLPQSPVSNVDLHLFGSERGLLATPTKCGAYPVQSAFTPWDSALAQQSSTQYFMLSSGSGGGPCPASPRPFAPGLRAGVSNSTAGAHTPLSLELTRSDGDQGLSALTVTTPPGSLATLKGIPYCPDAALAAAATPSYSGLAQQADPSCPTSSQIGASLAGAGAGTHPVYLPGKVYLAGPYKGAPLSLAVITPAVSGPYDLGSVVVRAALRVNPETAQVTAVSDPLPQILQGIPLRLRSVLLNLNRPNFTLNPTNCSPFAVNSEVFGSEGAVAHPSAHFQVANCASLPFAPQLALKLKGSTKRSGNPALTATLTYPKAPYANIASTTVALPPTEQIDNAHIRSPCTKVQFNLGNALGEKCPAASVIGFARADTPLLAAPLEGPVYFRSAPENKSGLPDIVAVLRGQIEITLDGKIKTVFQKLPNGAKVPRITTTFAAVPDAPVSKFTLNLDGANKGLLVNNANLCKAPLRVNVKMAGQNGKAIEENPLLGTPCGGKGRKNVKGHGKTRANPNRKAGR